MIGDCQVCDSTGSPTGNHSVYNPSSQTEKPLNVSFYERDGNERPVPLVSARDMLREGPRTGVPCLGARRVLRRPIPVLASRLLTAHFSTSLSSGPSVFRLENKRTEEILSSITSIRHLKKKKKIRISGCKSLTT